jgi:hypothetical protein
MHVQLSGTELMFSMANLALQLLTGLAPYLNILDAMALTIVVQVLLKLKVLLVQKR